jgi:hypothetical protein
MGTYNSIDVEDQGMSPTTRFIRIQLLLAIDQKVLCTLAIEADTEAFVLDVCHLQLCNGRDREGRGFEDYAVVWAAATCLVQSAHIFVADFLRDGEELVGSNLGHEAVSTSAPGVDVEVVEFAAVCFDGGEDAGVAVYEL